MHDLDRSQNMFEGDFESYEGDVFEFADESEFGDFEAESSLDEVEEMEMAAQLLEITDEAELDQFLGSLIKKAGRAAGRFIKSPIGRQLGGLLKGAVKKALPMAGSALGNLVAPGIGGAIGGKLASAAGGMFGLELEGLSPQDQEFEVARRVVRFANTAAQKVAQAPPTAPSQAVVKKALVEAARRHAPGLIRGGAGAITNIATGGDGANGASASANSGRWIRRGRKIILIGV